MNDDVPTLDLPSSYAEMSELRDQFTRFLLTYEAGMAEVETKVRILQQEFTHVHDYNPIEHVATRLKSVEGILEKAARKGVPATPESLREHVTDIAGVRVVCSFLSDVYDVEEMLCGQSDITVLRLRDYIANPKPNGYRSLHALVEVPVFLSQEVVKVPVEVQFRTSAMDFWASLEHKIYYKYDRTVPAELIDGLTEAAETAARLDADMERLHAQIRGR